MGPHQPQSFPTCPNAATQLPTQTSGVLRPLGLVFYACDSLVSPQGQHSLPLPLDGPLAPAPGCSAILWKTHVPGTRGHEPQWGRGHKEWKPGAPMVLPLVATPGGPEAAGRGESLVLTQGPFDFFSFLFGLFFL